MGKLKRIPPVGLIVEGDTEYLALPKLHSKQLLSNCPPLKVINPKGVGGYRTAKGIAEMVLPKVLAHAAAGCKKVIICLDREDREDCPGQLAEKIRSAILKRLKDTCETKRGGEQIAEQLHVVIINRAFEAFLLAGAPGLYQKGLLKRNPPRQCFEGRTGERSQKGAVELTHLLGRHYNKTTDGPYLFEHIDFDAAREYQGSKLGSRSLDKLLRTIGV